VHAFAGRLCGQMQKFDLGRDLAIRSIRVRIAYIVRGRAGARQASVVDHTNCRRSSRCERRAPSAGIASGLEKRLVVESSKGYGMTESVLSRISRRHADRRPGSCGRWFQPPMRIVHLESREDVALGDRVSC